VNEGIQLGRNLRALEMAKSMGLKIVRRIAKIESEKMGLAEEICLRYLTERIRYDLGEKEINGILTYAKFLSELEEIEAIPGLKFYSE
jgi:predicted solute-binding protein